MISRDPFQPHLFCASCYRDLYPVLVRILQSLPELLSTCHGRSPVIELSVQRATAVVTLLIHVTQTAGYTAELQAKLSRWALFVTSSVYLSSWHPVFPLFDLETWLLPSVFPSFWMVYCPTCESLRGGVYSL